MVAQLPEDPRGEEARSLCRRIATARELERPQVVLDCSFLRQPDAATTYLLLCCLEEALKRNGDVKLAAIPPESVAMFAAAGIIRLFDIYETTDDAVNSFHKKYTAFDIPATALSQSATQAAEEAA